MTGDPETKGGVAAGGREVAGATGYARAIPVILASQSPRRRDLLALARIHAECRPADLDESVLEGESPESYVERLARAKAAAVAVGGDGDALVIAADTTVVVDGEIFGKPEDEADARRMVRALAGRSHVVLTAVAVRRGGRTVSAVERVEVTFRELDDREIAAYVATGEPMDKAGSYGIQGYGATLVTRVEGDYFAVMGLPLARLVLLMRELGVAYAFGQPEEGQGVDRQRDGLASVQSRITRR